MQCHTFLLERVETPIGGALLVTDDDERLRVLYFDDYETRMRRQLRLHYGPDVALRERHARSRAARALAAYFEGDLAAVDGVEVATGGTPFQRAVWAALRQIPPGKTMSYGELAGTIGNPTAVRAVGLANGANPISIVVPCHRVIGSTGSLTGYGGGIERKRWLLAHEGLALPF